VPPHQHTQLGKPPLVDLQSRHELELVDRPARIQALRAPHTGEVPLAVDRQQPLATQTLQPAVAEFEAASLEGLAQLG
jgi:hypothetical protein